MQAHPHADFLRGVIVLHRKVQKTENDQAEETEVVEETGSARIILALDLAKILSDFSAIQTDASPELKAPVATESTPTPTPETEKQS